jgi:hypothetical protein
MVVGTDAAVALIVNVFVVLPLMKLTRTCGATVFVWFARTKTRTHALRFCTNGTAGEGYSCVACVTYKPSIDKSSVPEDVVTVKLFVDVAVPPAVVTVIFPVVVPLATVAVICVALFTT